MSFPVSKISGVDGQPKLLLIKNERVQRVDSIRFLCALAVVFSHTPIPFFDTFSVSSKLFLSPVTWGLTNGSGAVAIFFVISGFSIHWPYRTLKKIHATTFILSRLTRIGLPWLGALGVNAVLGCPNSIPNQLVYWSLYAEVIYYLTYPAVLFVTRRIGWTPVFGLSLVGSLVVYWLWGRNDYTVHASGTLVTALLTWPAWLIGVKLAQDLPKKIDTSKKQLSFLRVSLFIGSYCLVLLNFHSPIHIGLTFNLFAGLVYFWLLHELQSGNASRVYPWLESAGRWSYSVYLVHTPIRIAVEKLNIDPFTQYTLSIIGALLLSYTFFQLIERPSHHLSRYFSRRR